MTRQPPLVSVGGVVEALLAGLRPWPENPRTITAERLDALMRAMVEDRPMLFARPLVALPDGTVMLGNQRLRAAQELGWPTLPVLFVDLDPVRARIWALRDNNQYGEWDTPALAELLVELETDGIDLALAGFAAADLDRILAALPRPQDPDDAPPLPAGEPDSKVGEVYELGEHRLLCDDSRSAERLAALTGGVEVEVLWTDPPYGVSYIGKTDAAMTISNDDRNGLPALLREALAAADTVMAPSARFYIAAPAGPAGTVFRLAVEEVGWRHHQTLAWVKNTIVLGHSDHHYQHEDVLYGWKPGPGRPGRGRHQGSRWYGGNSQSSVFHIDRPARSAGHPTMKPVALIEAQLRNSSRRGDAVLDPFAGSGSTLIACQAAAEAERKLGRAWGEQIAQFTKLIEASMLTYAQQLRAGGVRITASEFVGLAKLVMQLHGDPTERIELVADSTEWQALRTRILDAVAEYPEARAALAEALEQGRDGS